MVGHLVAEILEPVVGELVLAGLGLLEGEDVDVALASQSATRSIRERMELTFQVAMRTVPYPNERVGQRPDRPAGTGRSRGDWWATAGAWPPTD